MNPSTHRQPDGDTHWSIPPEFGRLVGRSLLDVAENGWPLDRIRAMRTIMQIEKSCYEQHRLEEVKRRQLGTLQAEADELLAEINAVLRHVEGADSECPATIRTPV